MDLLGNAGLVAKNLPALLLGLTIFVFLFDLVRNRTWATLELGKVGGHLKALGATALAGLIILAVASAAGQPFSDTAFYFAGLGLTYVFATLSLKPAMRTMLHLASAVALTMLVPGEKLTLAAASYLMGAVSIRLVLNMLKPKDSRLDDVAPPFVYLAAMLFAYSGEAGSGHTEKFSGMINSAFIISTLMTLMQRPFMRDDKILVKRLVLTLSGGLAYLVMVTKAVEAPEYMRLAALVGAGYGMAYALDAIAIKKDCATSAVKQILIIGIFTLLGTRLFGNLGMAALGAGCMVGTFSQIPACAAIFFGARILEQVFAYTNVSNVTGINLNHPYVSASLYLGLFSALGLMVLLKDISDRRITATAFALLSAAGTCAVSYFLHSEAAGGYLISLIVSSILVAIVGQSFFPEEEEKVVNVALVPALATSCAIVTAGLLQLGLSATIEDRMTVIGAIAAVTVVVLLASYFMGRKPATSSGEPVAVSGD
ncbi:hypothetical protein BH11CYA1_BH11CYA1_17780 [soil metagenome]